MEVSIFGALDLARNSRKYKASGAPGALAGSFFGTGAEFLREISSEKEQV